MTLSVKVRYYLNQNMSSMDTQVMGNAHCAQRLTVLQRLIWKIILFTSLCPLGMNDKWH